jgi:hypothetical protein
MSGRSIFAWIKEAIMGEKEETCSPPEAGTAARIKVRVDLAKDGPCWNYAIEADDHASDPFVKAGNKIVFPKGQPTSIIEFRLQGKAGHTLDFDFADPPGPMWVQAGDCPTAQCGVPGEITVLASSTANRLEVENKNLIKEDFYYRLNFVDAGGNKLHWDPIIRNGGDGGP